MAHIQVIDKCHSSYRGTRPNPVKSLPGIAFSKCSSSCSYYGTGGTIKGSLTNPENDCWNYCGYSTGNQMTLTIYIYTLTAVHHTTRYYIMLQLLHML